MKDADLRKLVESFGSVVYKDVVATFDENGADIATEAATAAYIKEQVAGQTYDDTGIRAEVAQLKSDVDNYQSIALGYFIQLKELIENGGTSQEAIAVLDSAILDMTTLA